MFLVGDARARRQKRLGPQSTATDRAASPVPDFPRKRGRAGSGIPRPPLLLVLLALLALGARHFSAGGGPWEGYVRGAARSDGGREKEGGDSGGRGEDAPSAAGRRTEGSREKEGGGSGSGGRWEDAPSAAGPSRAVEGARVTTGEDPPGLRATPGTYAEDATVHGMWRDLGCGRIFKRERPVHSQVAWLNARALYRSVVGDESSIGRSAQDDVDHPNGFAVKVEAKQAGHKGRGVFAAQDISRGSLVWSTRKTARFRTGAQYRKFIYGLEPGFACDVLQWAYVQDVGRGRLRASVDLDEGCFCNNGHSGGANVGCHETAAEEYEGGCVENYFATQDLKAGDELLCAYGEFAVPSGWRKFGL